MKIAVFGASGATGEQVVSQALAADHQVIALVRTPAKVKLKHENLKVEEANIFDETSLKDHIRECDVVISCLGSTKRGATTVYSGSMKNIIGAMQETGVKRLVTMTTTNTNGDKPPGYDSGLKGMMYGFIIWLIKHTLEDMARMEEYLKGLTDSNVIWTCVKPPVLTNKPSKDEEIKTSDGQYVEGCALQISREDVAKFMLKVATSEEEIFPNQLVAIGIEKSE